MCIARETLVIIKRETYLPPVTVTLIGKCPKKSYKILECPQMILCVLTPVDQGSLFKWQECPRKFTPLKRWEPKKNWKKQTNQQHAQQLGGQSLMVENDFIFNSLFSFSVLVINFQIFWFLNTLEIWLTNKYSFIFKYIQYL